MKKRMPLILALFAFLPVYPGVRYYVGDAAAVWNNAAYWSDTSGGAGGAGIPTSSDTVYFDSNSFNGSPRSITTGVAVCHTIDVSGITLASFSIVPGSGGNLFIYGSIINKPGVVWNTSQGNITLCATTPQTITSNGGSFQNLSFNGVGGTWTLMDNLYAMGIQMTNGELDSNGFNMDITTFSTLNGTKTLTLRNSTIFTLQQWYPSASSGFTLNYNQATFNFKSRSTGTNPAISYPLTCYNLTFFGPNATNTMSQELRINSHVTVLNHLTARGWNATDKRARIYGMNAAGFNLSTKTASLENVDITGIIGMGDFNWDLSATNCGNQGTTGITFRPGQNLYWYVGSGNYSDSTKWFTSSGGSGTSGTIIPLAQDTAILDQNSFSANGQSISLNLLWGPGKFDMSVDDNTTSLTFTQAMTFFGTLLTASNTTIPGQPHLRQTPLYNSYLYIGSNSLAYYTTAWSVAPKKVTMLCDLNVALNASGFITVNSGLDMNGFNINAYYMTGPNTIPAGDNTLNFGSGYHTFWGSSGYSSALSLGSNATTVDYGTATFDINCSLASGTGMSLTLPRSSTMHRLILRGSTVRYYNLYATSPFYIKNLEVRDGKTVRFNSNYKYQFDNITTSAPAGYYVTFEPTSTTNYQFENVSSSDIILNNVNISKCTATGFARIRTLLGSPYQNMSAFIRAPYLDIKTVVGVSKITRWRAYGSIDGGNNSGIIFYPAL